MRFLMLLMAFVVSLVSTHAQASRASDEVTQADDLHEQSRIVRASCPIQGRKGRSMDSARRVSPSAPESDRL